MSPATVSVSKRAKISPLADSREGRVTDAAPSARHFFIVARDNPSLYDYLRNQFTLDTNVEIVVDRRRGARRVEQTSVEVERRRSDRRSRPEVDAELKVRTHVFQTVPAPPEARPVQS